MSRLVKVLRTSRLPILRQLKIEEALLRATDDNWCFINDGTPGPAVVMGISGKPQVLVNCAEAHRDRVQVIKRFSGGGTVVVDEDTILASLIMNSEALPSVPVFPAPIMDWTEGFYRPAFPTHFALRENDYVFGSAKFGGNAQCITKERWLHHTSFLWDYRREHMAYLQHPPKAPQYREGRPHDDFLCKLHQHVPCRVGFVDGLQRCLEAAGFATEEVQVEDVAHLLARKYHKSTKTVDLAAFVESESVPPLSR